MQSSWENFWKKNQPGSFVKVSWSKRRAVHILEQYVSKNMNVLDAGCGSGFFSKFFCDQGTRTTALDYSPAALELAKRVTKGRVKTVRADLVSEKLKNIFDERFDLIFTDGLFEHFSSQDQDQILQNFCSVLAPQGLIITFVPNRWSPWQLLRPFVMPGIKEQPFILKQLVRLNERNGLKVISSGGINTLPFRFSLEGSVASVLGMLLFTVGKRSP